jgi:hypothetical protein
MPKMNNSPKNASILFGTYSTGFRHFITKICILLFVQNLASKSVQLLISNYSLETNRIQREFLFNNGIPSQEFLSASKPPRQKTNLFKQRRAVTSRRRKPFPQPQNCHAKKQTFSNRALL